MVILNNSDNTKVNKEKKNTQNSISLRKIYVNILMNDIWGVCAWERERRREREMQIGKIILYSWSYTVLPIW